MDAEVLRREAAVLAAIEHPHILIVHEVGVADDGLYLVTEFMPEGSLADRLDRGALTELEALTAARQAASALAAGHERGILHRDVKPANLLLASDGRVKVSDFGLAVHTVPPSTAASAVSATVTLPGDEGSGRLFGTPLYIPPEALAGAAPSPQGDQFAFGVALHEMLTGKRPFLRKRGLQAVLDPPSIDPSLRQDVSRIVARCIAKDARERYASMDEVVAAYSIVRSHAAARTGSGSGGSSSSSCCPRSFFSPDGVSELGGPGREAMRSQRGGSRGPRGREVRRREESLSRVARSRPGLSRRMHEPRHPRAARHRSVVGPSQSWEIARARSATTTWSSTTTHRPCGARAISRGPRPPCERRWRSPPDGRWSWLFSTS
jgi:serine/threonine-protein kinase